MTAAAGRGDAGKRRRQDRRRAGRGGPRAGRSPARRSEDRQAAGRNRCAGGDGQIGGSAAGRGQAGADPRSSDLFDARYRHAGRIRQSRDHASRRPMPSVGQAQANLAVARPAGPRRRDQGRRVPGQAGEQPRSIRRAGGLASATILAPAAGRIDDIIRNPGDIAGPSSPVISMLPDGAVKLKVYRAGTGILIDRRWVRSCRVRCDGCTAGPDGTRQLRLARSRIHAAGDLLAGDPPEARLPRRGAAGRRRRRRCSRGRSSMWIWREQGSRPSAVGRNRCMPCSTASAFPRPTAALPTALPLLTGIA